MSVQMGFRCPKLLADDVKAYQRVTKQSRTDALISLLEIALSEVNKKHEPALNKVTEKMETILSINVQCLSILNQLGELAGDEVMSDAEHEFKEMMKSLGDNA
ncbi:hypothetical protein [Pseudoalteromonas galatheae]|uniref:hypothetical protein n=1 Tax=Pseudoalteromonas galatheae TaxID=579562 RepID=UPI0030CB3707